MWQPALEIKSGQRFGRLTVLTETANQKYLSGQTQRFFICRCDCGNITKVRLMHLTTGKTKSCGCLKKEFHKQVKTFWIEFRNRKKNFRTKHEKKN